MALRHGRCQTPMQLPWCERKVLRKIFGPVRVGDDYRIRTNRELYEIFNEMDVAKRINNQRYRWLSHVVRMDENAFPRRVFEVVGGHQRVGRPHTRWKDQVEKVRLRMV